MTDQPMTAEREAEIREFSQTSAFGALAARELLAALDACRRERDEAREVIAAAEALSNFLENEKETTSPPDELLSAQCVACESSADYEREEVLSENLARALSAYRGQRGQQ